MRRKEGGSGRTTGANPSGVDLLLQAHYNESRNVSNGKESYMPSSTLTSKGQTTVPREVRDHFKLQSGDKIDFIIHADGSVSVQPVTVHVKELKGMLHRRKMKPVSLDAMNLAIRKRFRPGR